MKTEKIRVIDYAKSRQVQAREVIEAAKSQGQIINAMTLITFREATTLDGVLNERIDKTETLADLFKRILQENIQFHKDRQRRRFERIDAMRAAGLPTPRRQSRSDRDPVGGPDHSERGTRGDNRRPRRLGPANEQRGGERRHYNNDRPQRDGERRQYNNDRPQRDGERRSYNSDRPQRDGERRSYNNDRPQRGGEHRSYNNDRPQRGGERRSYNNDRPQRGGERRSYNNDRPQRSEKTGVNRRLEEKKRDAERDAARGGRPPKRKGDRKVKQFKKSE
ncbi:MAG: hypothetical protein ACRDAO_00600 [Culicoidibacterales bacterium]